MNKYFTKKTIIIPLIIVGSLVTIRVFSLMRTAPLPNTSTTEEQARTQTQADKKFSEQINKVYSMYPWYDKLPILTDLYFIYFDLAREEFVGIIYSSDVLTIENSKLKITQEIKTIAGQDSLKYPTRWKTE